jgi:hypothetical protein
MTLEILESVSYKRSLIIGTLLGDACSRRRDSGGRMKAEYIILHSLKQADIVEWFSREIGRLYARDIKLTLRRLKDGGFFFQRAILLKLVALL